MGIRAGFSFLRMTRRSARHRAALLGRVLNDGLRRDRQGGAADAPVFSMTSQAVRFVSAVEKAFRATK
jgi:hypothetical protein